jgi:GMP synthase (glutamine-hydrolysing)
MLSDSLKTKSSDQIINLMKPLLLNLRHENFPILGICFGAQLLVYLEGVKVVNDSRLAERGTYPTVLTKEGKESPLLKDTPETFEAQFGHLESITSLPKGGKVLATNTQKTQIHVFVLRQNVCGVMWHPELDVTRQKERARFYLTEEEFAMFEKKLKSSPDAGRVLINYLYA